MLAVGKDGGYKLYLLRKEEGEEEMAVGGLLVIST
jgi:hypothetical protein